MRLYSIQLVPLIDAEDYRKNEALKAFDVITATEPELPLPVRRLLQQQKLLHFVLHRTAAAPNESRLRVFAYVLRSVPFAALSVNLTSALPLLLKGLNHGDPVTVQILVNAIDLLIEHQNDMILGHLNHLIPLYLKLSTFKDSMVSDE